LQLRSQNKWVKNYWADLMTKNQKLKKYNVVSPQEVFKNDLKSLYNRNLKNNFYLKNNFFFKFYNNNFDFTSSANDVNMFSASNSLVNENYFFLNKSKRKFWNNTELNDFLSREDNNSFFKNCFAAYKRRKQHKLKKSIFMSLENNNTNNTILLSHHNDFFEFSRFYKKSAGIKLPLRLIKYPLVNEINNNTFYNGENFVSLFRLRFNKTDLNIEQKLAPQSVFLTLKQKRYRRRTNINDFSCLYKDKAEGSKGSKLIRYSGKLFLKNNAIFEENQIDPTQCYRMLKKNKNRYEHIPVVYSKRMLRTQRTLVLPAHVNITAITNSYDVVHS